MEKSLESEKSLKKFAPWALWGIAVFLWVFGLLPPLVYGISHVGVYFMLICAAALTFVGLFWRMLGDWLSKRLRFRAALKWMFFVLLALFLILNLAMLWFAYAAEPPEKTEGNMIILGCGLFGNRPSLMLENRLEVGLGYLLTNPEIICVVSGGLGDGLVYTESEVMKEWLVNKGIAPERIIEENRSRNTLQNVGYSCDILTEMGRADMPIIIVTNNFHQLRAHMVAVYEGYSLVYHLSGARPWGLIPAYWFREYFGFVQYVLKLY